VAEVRPASQRDWGCGMPARCARARLSRADVSAGPQRRMPTAAPATLTRHHGGGASAGTIGCRRDTGSSSTLLAGGKHPLCQAWPDVTPALDPLCRLAIPPGAARGPIRRAKQRHEGGVLPYTANARQFQPCCSCASRPHRPSRSRRYSMTIARKWFDHSIYKDTLCRQRTERHPADGYYLIRDDRELRTHPPADARRDRQNATKRPT